jgi:hypothetical protein
VPGAALAFWVSAQNEPLHYPCGFVEAPSHVKRHPCVISGSARKGIRHVVCSRDPNAQNPQSHGKRSQHPLQELIVKRGAEAAQGNHRRMTEEIGHQLEGLLCLG